MVEVTWSEPALAQLDAIAEYIALDNPSAAGKLVARTFDAVARLEDFPQSGRVPPELPNAIYREVIVSPCRILYREDGVRVIVLCVLRVERELRAYVQRHGLEEEASRLLLIRLLP